MNEAFFLKYVHHDICSCSKAVCCYLGSCEKETLVDRTRVPHLRKQIICQKIGCPWFIHAFIYKVFRYWKKSLSHILHWQKLASRWHSANSLPAQNRIQLENDHFRLIYWLPWSCVHPQAHNLLSNHCQRRGRTSMKKIKKALLFDLFCLIAPFPHMRPLCYVFPPESDHCTIKTYLRTGQQKQKWVKWIDL